MIKLPEKILIASHNQGKVKEINALFAPFNISAISAAALNLPEPEETEKTFAGNALLKAHAAAKAANMVALADDSGLEVMALNGAPGIYSARWAGESRDFKFAMKRIEEELKACNARDYSARFVCVLALAWPDGREETFFGTVDGHLEFPPRGENGFGYDPIFVRNGDKITFGEMAAAEKHAISHRANAFNLLIKACFGNG